MVINKGQGYLLGLVLASTLSANIQPVSALNTQCGDDLEGNASLATYVLCSTFAPLAATDLYSFNGNQYEPNAPLIQLSQNNNPTALFPKYDGGLLNKTDTKLVARELFVGGLTVSKYDKTPVMANKVFVSSQHENQTMVVSMTSGESTSINKENQPNEIRHSPEQNRRYVANSQYLRRGTLVSTNYNTVSMQRTMEDLQNIGYLGMNDVNAEPLSEALTRELKLTTNVAFVPDNSCVNIVDSILPPACQNKNVEKTMATMSMIHDKTLSAQMNENFSFWQSMNISEQKASK